MPLELAANNLSGTARYPTPAEIEKMTAVEVMMFSMRKMAISGNWEAAARVAAMVAPYCHQTFAPRTADDEPDRACS